MNTVTTRLEQAGITLPAPAAPVAAYAPFVHSNGLLFISGQISLGPDGLITGQVGAELSLEQGQYAARICAINLLAQINAALSGLEQARIVRLGGFVATAPGFFDIAKVMDGASQLMLDIFGDAGRHARAAIGCPQLPLNAAVEIDAIVSQQ